MSDEDLQRTVAELLTRLTNLTAASSSSFRRLEVDVEEIKQQKYRPYFASAGAFLVVVMGVMGYVYSLETRLTGMLFNLNSDVAVVDERVNVVETRFEQRTETMRTRWEVHSDQHLSMNEGMRIMLKEILDARHPSEALPDEH